MMKYLTLNPSKNLYTPREKIFCCILSYGLSIEVLNPLKMKHA